MSGARLPSRFAYFADIRLANGCCTYDAELFCC
jgi:hypothetical protein